MTRQELAQLCKTRRRELGLTQNDLAIQVGFGKIRISEFENNRRNFNTDSMLRILEVLKLEISQSI